MHTIPLKMPPPRPLGQLKHLFLHWLLSLVVGTRTKEEGDGPASRALRQAMAYAFDADAAGQRFHGSPLPCQHLDSFLFKRCTLSDLPGPL